MNDSVRVRVPATSANLGPGFDALGLALRLANTVTMRRAAKPAPDAFGGFTVARADGSYQRFRVAAIEK